MLPDLFSINKQDTLSTRYPFEKVRMQAYIKFIFNKEGNCDVNEILYLIWKKNPTKGPSLFFFF